MERKLIEKKIKDLTWYENYYVEQLQFTRAELEVYKGFLQREDSQ